MNNYILLYSTRFKKDYKKLALQPEKLEAIKNTLTMLFQNGYAAIPATIRPHKLSGNYKGCLECHILPDLLLTWEQYEVEKEILLIRIGSHSELF
ncbi:MAG TPA: type II toxin-antitoxin system YafQ family toxin [Petrimonas sp.]|uniref:type II toxin-antitoxin system YafQ family toxin n=1 Tax=Petrimonas sp. TaxID=2023866 RepID=UPI00175CA16A|nr:type II toxin-antitoxin system YafQ family toxin [Petrimonas sp.]